MQQQALQWSGGANKGRQIAVFPGHARTVIAALAARCTFNAGVIHTRQFGVQAIRVVGASHHLTGMGSEVANHGPVAIIVVLATAIR